jgi:hypothetical protein
MTSSGRIPLPLEGYWTPNTSPSPCRKRSFFKSKFPDFLFRQIVLCPLNHLLQCLGITRSALFNDLPYTISLPGTGTTIGEIIDRLITSLSAAPSSSANSLVQFLYEIDPYDLESLQRGVRVYSSSYRYYEYDTTMTKIPIADHAIQPSGGAISQLAWKLSKMKHTGIVNISQRCQVQSERVINSLLIITQFELQRKHKYVGNYPCDDKIGGKRKIRRRQLFMKEEGMVVV